MADDVTRCLRMSREPESVERERCMAAGLFGDWIRDESVERSPEAIRSGASKAIEAACIFWEQWDIAVLTPDVTQESEGLPVPEAFEVED